MDTWLTSRQLTVMMHNGEVHKANELNSIYEHYIRHLTLIQFVLLLYRLEKCYVINSFYEVPRPRPFYRLQITISDIRHLKEFKKTNETVEYYHIWNTFSPQLNYLNKKYVCVPLSYLIQCILRYSIVSWWLL